MDNFSWVVNLLRIAPFRKDQGSKVSLQGLTDEPHPLSCSTEAILVRGSSSSSKLEERGSPPSRPGQGSVAKDRTLIR